eukprot:g14028.t1
MTEQLRNSKLESDSLRVQLKASTGPRRDVLREERPDSGRARERRSPLLAVAECASSFGLPSQITASQLMESKYSLLQARVEHLELDLSFKAAFGSNVRGVGDEAVLGMSTTSAPSETGRGNTRDDFLASLTTEMPAPSFPRLRGNANLLRAGISGLSGPTAMPTSTGYPSISASTSVEMPNAGAFGTGGLSEMPSAAWENPRRNTAGPASGGTSTMDLAKARWVYSVLCTEMAWAAA